MLELRGDGLVGHFSGILAAPAMATTSPSMGTLNRANTTAEERNIGDLIASAAGIRNRTNSIIVSTTIVAPARHINRRNISARHRALINNMERPMAGTTLELDVIDAMGSKGNNELIKLDIATKDIRPVVFNRPDGVAFADPEMSTKAAWGKCLAPVMPSSNSTDGDSDMGCFPPNLRRTPES